MSNSFAVVHNHEFSKFTFLLEAISMLLHSTGNDLRVPKGKIFLPLGFTASAPSDNFQGKGQNIQGKQMLRSRVLFPLTIFFIAAMTISHISSEIYFI